MSLNSNNFLSLQYGVANFTDLTSGQAGRGASSFNSSKSLYSVCLYGDNFLSLQNGVANGALRALGQTDGSAGCFNAGNSNRSVLQRSDVVNCGYNSTTISADTTGSEAGSGAGGLGSLRILNIVSLHSTGNGTSVGHVATNALSGLSCVCGAGSIVVGGVFTKGVTQSSDFLLLYSEFTANGALHTSSQTSFGASRSSSSNELSGVAGSRNFFLSYSDFATDFALLTSSQTGLSASRSSRFNYHEIMSESGQHFENFDYIAALIGALYVDATIVETVSFFGNGIFIVKMTGRYSRTIDNGLCISIGVNTSEGGLHCNCRNCNSSSSLFEVLCDLECYSESSTGLSYVGSFSSRHNKQNLLVALVGNDGSAKSISITVLDVNLAVFVRINRNENSGIILKVDFNLRCAGVIFDYYFNLYDVAGIQRFCDIRSGVRLHCDVEGSCVSSANCYDSHREHHNSNQKRFHHSFKLHDSPH